jgi:hypothetical protein
MFKAKFITRGLSLVCFVGMALATVAAPAVTVQKVTTATLGAASERQPFVLDLTKLKTIYQLSGLAAADPPRIVVRTKGQVMPLFSFLGMAKLDSPRQAQSVIMSGETSSELVGIIPEAAATSFECTILFCTCEGRADCKDLFDEGLCHGWVACDFRGHCSCGRRTVR